MIKKFKFSFQDCSSLIIVSLCNVRFFLIKNIENKFKFHVIPSSCLFQKNTIFISLFVKNFKDSFTSKLFFWFNCLNKKLKQKLFLKGLGFRCFLSDDKTKILFKLGYSHIVFLMIPESISSIVIEKTFIVVEGYNRTVLGNFCKLIKKLKKVDVYKNKGFSYPKEKVITKVIKKN